ncbi:hypothetical protein [Clostridium sp. DJ247]|nr:hypothetical protein [Clostridium sp. DJ247]
MRFYDKFKNIHEILKLYGCKATYKEHGEYSKELVSVLNVEP